MSLALSVCTCIPKLPRFKKISNAVKFCSTIFAMTPVKAPVFSNMQHTHTHSLQLLRLAVTATASNH